MSHRARIVITAAAAAAALALLAAACGTDPEPAATPAATEQPATTSPEATTSAAPGPAAETETPPAGEEDPATEPAGAEPEPAATTAVPSVAVEPSVVPSAGSWDFTIEGSGFTPGLSVYTLVCTLPGDPLTADAPAEQVEAAMAQIGRNDCYLDTAEEATVADDGTFTAQRTFEADESFAWVASDELETEAAAAAVLLEQLGPWGRARLEPVPASELYPDGDPDANPYPDDFLCLYIDRELDCWHEAPDPGAEPPADAEPPAATEPEPGPEPEPVGEPGPAPDAGIDPTDDEPEPEVPVISVPPDEPEPEPEPEPQPEPEPEPEPEEPDAEADAWARARLGPVPASELYPEGDPDGNPYPDDFLCTYIDGVLDCWHEQPDSGPWARVLTEPVRASELWPDDGPWPDDYLCESVGGEVVCEQDPDHDWTPPRAGTEPEVYPLCAEGATGWDCRPRPEWLRGDGTVRPAFPFDQPRETQPVAAWRSWCQALDSTGWCRLLLSEAHQALDYLGARTECVLSAYRERLEYYLSQGAGAFESYARETFSWILCATVIDPITKSLPAGHAGSDAGYRLSDTPGMTLADRCRAVLTTPYPDIELETRWTVGGDPPVEFGQDCDAWAAYVEARNSYRTHPQCLAANKLAEEWMEHVHRQPERYFPPDC